MHTPTPWKYLESSGFVESVGHSQMIICCPHSNDESPSAEAFPDNAAYIVRAVNSHAAIVAALETAIPLVASIVTTDGSDTPVYPAVIAAARAALAAAKGE